MTGQSTSEYVGGLPPGFLLHEYQIERVLGHGGFGVTYLARDTLLQKTVAIKEYLPMELAVRANANTVSVRSSADRQAFEQGMSSFLNEARVLARFNHPNLIGVYRFFQANSTAYFVMEYAEGDTLKAHIKKAGALTEERIRELLMPMLKGLESVHNAGILHRDIKPENILVRADGTAVLIDFGAARYSVSSRSRAITSIITAGYAPMEQYSTSGHQGPWSDIYALGAVMYYAIVGRKPIDAISRIHDDPLVPASLAGKGRYADGFLAAVDWALRVKADERPKTLTEWRLALEGTQPAPVFESTSGTVDIALTMQRGESAPAPPASAEATVRTADRSVETGDPRARREKLEAELRELERQERLEKERQERERAEAERRAREEAERKAREEAEQRAREEAERKAREEAERRAREEQERQERERAEAERRAREQRERQERERAEAERRERDRLAREEAARKAREEAERRARLKAEEQARKDAERRAREDQRAKEKAQATARKAAAQDAKRQAAHAQAPARRRGRGLAIAATLAVGAVLVGVYYSRPGEEAVQAPPTLKQAPSVLAPQPLAAPAAAVKTPENDRQRALEQEQALARQKQAEEQARAAEEERLRREEEDRRAMARARQAEEERAAAEAKRRAREDAQRAETERLRRDQEAAAAEAEAARKAEIAERERRAEEKRAQAEAERRRRAEEAARRKAEEEKKAKTDDDPVVGF